MEAEQDIELLGERRGLIFEGREELTHSAMDSRRREIERGESIEKKEGKHDKQKEEENRHCEGEESSEGIQGGLG